MDPNEALKQLRARMARMQKIIDRSGEMSPGRNAADLIALGVAANEAVDLWNGLDQWMSRSGALPDAWRAGR